jgi:hypothetical protein
MRLVGTHGTVLLDLYHGFAATEPGAVSRTRKVLHPFDESMRRIAAAGANLTRRAVRREPAYPGLRPLVAAFHAAVRGGPVPIESETMLRQAQARDRLIALAGLIPPMES